MQFIATKSSGETKDFSSYILKQMSGEMTREEVEQKIYEFHNE